MNREQRRLKAKAVPQAERQAWAAESVRTDNEQRKIFIDQKAMEVAMTLARDLLRSCYSAGGDGLHSVPPHLRMTADELIKTGDLIPLGIARADGSRAVKVSAAGVELLKELETHELGHIEMKSGDLPSIDVSPKPAIIV